MDFVNLDNDFNVQYIGSKVAMNKLNRSVQTNDSSDNGRPNHSTSSTLSVDLFADIEREEETFGESINESNLEDEGETDFHDMFASSRNIIEPCVYSKMDDSGIHDESM